MSRKLFGLLIASILGIGLYCNVAYPAEKTTVGKLIKTADLPANIQAQKAKKQSKHAAAGIPACRTGRVIAGWQLVMDLDDVSEEDVAKHPCGEEKDIYVCSAFKRLSIRCSNPQEN